MVEVRVELAQCTGTICLPAHTTDVMQRSALGLNVPALHLVEDAITTTNLRDTLLMLPAEEDGPCNPAGVLALEEQALGLAILETEDLAVTADVQLALNMPSAHVHSNCSVAAASPFQKSSVPLWNIELVRHGARSEWRWNAPCPGRSSGR